MVQDTLERGYRVARVWPMRIRGCEATLPLTTPKGMQPEDVQQGRLPTCHLLASAQAVLVQIPNARQTLCAPHSDGVSVQYFDGVGADARTLVLPALRYDFSFFGKRCDLPAQRSDKAHAMWPAYVEQAFAYTHGGFAALTRRRNPGLSLTWLTGLPARTFTFGTDRTAEQHNDEIAMRHHRGECVVIHTKRHAYALVEVTRRDESVVLHLLNPLDGVPTKRRILQRGAGPLKIRGISHTVLGP